MVAYNPNVQNTILNELSNQETYIKRMKNAVKVVHAGKPIWINGKKRRSHITTACGIDLFDAPLISEKEGEVTCTWCALRLAMVRREHIPFYIDLEKERRKIAKRIKDYVIKTLKACPFVDFKGKPSRQIIISVESLNKFRELRVVDSKEVMTGKSKVRIDAQGRLSVMNEEKPTIALVTYMARPCNCKEEMKVKLESPTDVGCRQIVAELRKQWGETVREVDIISWRFV